jgi:CHAD domain-containing protein
MIESGKLDIQSSSTQALSRARRGTEKSQKNEAQEDSYAPTLKNAGETATRYPLMTEKLFGSLDKLEDAVDGMNTHPTLKQVSDSQIRNIARWVQVFSEAYADSYDSEDLKKAQKPIDDLAYICGQYKDAELVETQVRALFPDGKLPLKMQKDIGNLKEERAQEFHEFFKKFKHKKLPRSLEILRNPAPVDENMSPSEIARQDRKLMSREVERLIDNIGKVGLFHTDPERFHDGRKALRNLYAMMYVTGDVFDYEKSDVDGLFKIFMRFGDSQDKHIAQVWLEEKGYEKESAQVLEEQQTLQRDEMQEAEAFLDSGVLEHIRETAR